MRRMFTSAVAVMALLAFASTSALAAVTFDPDTGTGFVGKGDVQTALNWNNKQLQDNAASVAFSVDTVSVTESTWTCTNTNNDNVQLRERTTTTTTQGVVGSVARERNQITGFHLSGYSGAPTTSSVSSGQPLNSCPTNWVLGDTETSAPQVTGGGVYVNGVALG